MRPAAVLFCTVAFRGTSNVPSNERQPSISFDPRRKENKEKKSQKNAFHIKNNMPNHYEILGIDATVCECL